MSILIGGWIIQDEGKVRMWGDDGVECDYA